jgi:hypothetical protein
MKINNFMKYYINVTSLFLLLITAVFSQEKTVLKGTVNNWPTDSVYVQTMPFYSPHSSELKSLKLSEENVFEFQFNANKEAPIVIQVFSSKKTAKAIKAELLLSNYKDKYYYGYCNKFYTHGIATFLLEQNKTLDVALTHSESKRKLNAKVANAFREKGLKVNKDDTIVVEEKMKIDFKGENKFQQNYYQNSFGIDDRFDNRLKIYKNKSITEAIASLKKFKLKILKDLEEKKENLSVYFYDYLKAEIEFGAKKELLRFLMFEKEKTNFFATSVPKEILEFVEFDKSKITSTIIASEEYNKFLMLYLNFKLNIEHKKPNKFYDFNTKKIKKAIKVFPRESIYHFLGNNLLETNMECLIKSINNEEAIEELITKTITKYPNGELNDKLIEKYNL